MGVPVTAVRAGDQVIVAQGGDGANRNGFLPGIQVRCAFQDSFAQQVGDVVLQGSNFHHLAQVAQHLFFGQRLFFDQRRYFFHE
jgi:hypothetical protein